MAEFEAVLIDSGHVPAERRLTKSTLSEMMEKTVLPIEVFDRSNPDKIVGMIDELRLDGSRLIIRGSFSTSSGAKTAKIPVIRGQLLNDDGTLFGSPLLCRDPAEVCEMLLGADEEWKGVEGVVEDDRPLMTLSLTWMTEEQFKDLPEWDGP